MWKTLVRLRRARLRGIVSGVLMSLMVLSCTYLRKPSGPLPYKEIPAPHRVANGPVVIVLPGRADNLDDLERYGIAEAIQRGWPEASVVLVDATLPYYAEGRIAQRLHDEIVQPARARGHRQIWLTGASMGGMGVLLYERDYPWDVSGLLLMAPFMGAPSQVEAVAHAGGPAAWDPGPRPAHVDADNYQRELWRVVKRLHEDPARAARVWLVCGDRDRLLPATELIAPLLPAGHFIQESGGHEWTVWDAGATQAFTHIAAETPPATAP